MATSATLEQLLQYHRLLLAERRRRNPAGAAGREDALEWLLAELDEMEQRLRADPNFVEPSDAQKAQWGRELDAWFRSYAPRDQR
jgi:hypothetical protein